MAGDKVVMKDLKDHLRHAKKVGECIQVSWLSFCSCDDQFKSLFAIGDSQLISIPIYEKGHGKINLCSAFLKEVIQQCKDVLDDDAITDIIKSCNVIKNDKVQQAKRKVKGQAQKSKKSDTVAKKKAMDIHNDVFGDNDNYDKYDDIGGQYEDDFF